MTKKTLNEKFADMNHQRDGFLPRLKCQLDRLDVWAERHQFLVGVLCTLFVVSMAITIVNLELGRPWF